MMRRVGLGKGPQRSAAIVGLALWTGVLGACRGAPTADVTGRRSWPTPSAGGPVPPYAADPAAGARLFADHCTACHGTEGAGDGPLAAGLSPRPPNWTAADALKERPPATLYRAIRRGVLGTSMKRFDPVLDEQSTWDVVFHIWRVPVDAATRQRGADGYARRCASCHGPAGRPDPASAAPALDRPEWVALTRRQLVERIRDRHPDLAVAVDGSGDDLDTEAIAEHLWSFLTVTTGPPAAAASDRPALPGGGAP